MNEMMIKNRFVFVNYNVMIVYSYRSVIMRDRKDKNFSMKFFLAFHRFIQLKNIFYDNNYTVSVLLIDNIKNRDVTFYLACEKRKIHARRNQ